MEAEKYARMRLIRIGRTVLQDIEITVPDPRSPVVRRQIAEEVAGLDLEDEEEAMAWIEAVSEFHNDAPG